MEIEIGEKLNKDELIKAHLTISEEMERRDIKHKEGDGLDRATRKARRALKKSADSEEIIVTEKYEGLIREMEQIVKKAREFLQTTAKGSEEKSLAELNKGMSGKFIAQAHTRGESIHCDLRLHVVKPEKFDHLVGITVDTPGNKEKRNELLKPKDDEKILCQIKPSHPMSWLTVGEDGPVEVDPGEAGAGENISGEFVKIDGGSWKAGTQDEHYKEFWFIGEKIKGRWILTYAPVSGDEDEEKRVWLLSRPENQEMDTDEEENKGKTEKRRARIISKREKQHIVTGVVLEPDTTDLQGDTIMAEEIEKAAYQFMEYYGRIGYQHEKFDKELKIVESWVTSVDFVLNNVKVKSGSWLMSVRVLEPEIWEQIENGEITGFSIGGESRAEKAA